MYLGSMLANDDTIDTDVAYRNNTESLNWRELIGVLCDSKMPIRIKSKVYTIAIEKRKKQNAGRSRNNNRTNYKSPK